eukprot:TRINITY_DN28058_c0_g1_i1.p1 TRINITY_DN28058_c0_g1~~TRINITY_DN28058_c0_g1_i1.p1  ORF type:complete len:380 (-),score=61.80 TRINITY_DN28058_c0_g1_i1:140-1279(-)
MNTSLHSGSELPSFDLSPFMVDEGCVIGCSPTAAQIAMAKELDTALKTSGFLFLKKFGLDEAEVSKAFAVTKKLFAESNPRKSFAAYNAEKNMGYKTLGADVANHARPADLRESFALRSRRVVENDLKGTPEDMAEALDILWDRLEHAAFRFMLACGLALQLPNQDIDFFSRAHSKMSETCLTLVHYPPCDFVPDVSNGHGNSHGALRVGEHADFGMFTFLLLEESAPGLQVRKGVAGAASDQWGVRPEAEGAVPGCSGVTGTVSADSGGWTDVQGQGGTTAIVNVGAVMARWTNDRWPATVHRVIVPSKEDAACHRYSIPFFVQPDAEAMIQAHPAMLKDGGKPHYAPISARDHLQMKLEELVNKAANRRSDAKIGGS